VPRHMNASHGWKQKRIFFTTVHRSKEPFATLYGVARHKIESIKMRRAASHASVNRPRRRGQTRCRFAHPPQGVLRQRLTQFQLA
jgi:hypothetical protein